MRKKAIYILLAMSVITLAGCGKKLKVGKETIVAETKTDKETVDASTPTNTTTPTPYIKSEDDFTKEDFKNSEYVTIDDVNVRSGPDTESDVIDSMPKGSKVSVTGREEDSEGNKWYVVSLSDESTGYMSTKYVNLVHRKGDIK